MSTPESLEARNTDLEKDISKVEAERDFYMALVKRYRERSGAFIVGNFTLFGKAMFLARHIPVIGPRIGRSLEELAIYEEQRRASRRRQGK